MSNLTDEQLAKCREAYNHRYNTVVYEIWNDGWKQGYQQGQQSAAITQLEQAGEVDKRTLNTDALNKAIEVGAEQFGQQMRLGGGSLSEMFTRVIRAYLDAAAPAPKHGN